MPKIVDRKSYNGAEEKIDRLGLRPLWSELERILSGFQLLLEERRDANGGAVVREMLDQQFENASGWIKQQTGDVDWTKCLIVNGTRVCVGVEIQFSGRSDLIVVDVAHLRDQITAGVVDVGVLVVPTDRLGVYLTDRGPKLADAIRAVERSRATDLPLIILALEHDGPGPPLPKRRTRQGKAVT